MLRQFLFNIATDKDRGVAAIILRPVLRVLSWVYGLLVALMRWAYTSGVLRSYRSGRPVISVGNVMAGGVGKTPFVVCLVRMLRQSGKLPVVLMRGYAGGDDPDRKSDEARMLREQLKDVFIYPNPDRVHSMRLAEKEHLVDAFLLDDGFQHWKIKRDLDIVLVDALNPFGNEAMLPRGLLREPLSALERADVLVMTRVDQAPDQARELRRTLVAWNPKACVVETIHAPVSLTNVVSGNIVTDLALLKGKAIAFCGIGAPENFRATLEGLGAQLEEFVVFSDHYDYSAKDIADLVTLCRKKNISRIITTHKDAVKIRSFREAFAGIELWMLDIEIRITRGEHELRSRINLLFHS